MREYLLRLNRVPPETPRRRRSKPSPRKFSRPRTWASQPRRREFCIICPVLRRRAQSYSFFYAPEIRSTGSPVPDWLITGCSELLTLRGPVPRRGAALSDLGIIRDG